MKKIIVSFWKFFKATPVGKLIRFLSPQWLVNLLEHLPLAVLANIVYGFPSRKIKVIGVTGTDGKTTTTNMIYQILKKAGLKVSMVSTINAVVADQIYDTGFHVTSPHPFTVQEFIRRAVKAKSRYIVLEVTSHALDQYRFWGVKFDVGVITNVTHEHLDYHKTMDKYLKAKLKLVKNARNIVVNYNLGQVAKKATGKKVITFGFDIGSFNQNKYRLKLNIPGSYNIENGLAALAATAALGVDPQIAKKALSGLSGLGGRMEEVKNKKGIKVIIDFAHTPNALEQALKALREETNGKLISVFGAASQRDCEKRPMMGKISGKIADITILTDEDPRFESSDKIIEEIAQGVKELDLIEGKNLFKISDRMKAISLALSLAKKGDTVGIFGKGHEKSMNYKGIERDWSDREAVLKALHE